MDRNCDSRQVGAASGRDSPGARNEPYHYSREDQTSAHESLLSRDSSDEAASRQDRVVPSAHKETTSLNSTDEKALHRTFSRDSAFLRFIWDHWLYEILACSIAISALIAIVITLGTHADRPLPNWPYRISINALVSVFAVILKGLMMFSVAEAVNQMKWLWYKDARPLSDFAKFEDASRGSLGSLKLLLTLHGKQITSLGAAITVLAVAIDPFIQQVIIYYPCRQAFHGPEASILRTNNYTTSSSLPMQAALYQGIYKLYVDVQPTCVTGNCFFPDYRIVGVCHECRDITSTTTSRQAELKCQVDRDHKCPKLWQLSSGLNLTTNRESIGLRTIVGEGDSFDKGVFLSRTQILSQTGNSSEDTKVIAVECDLAPCVRTYRAEVLGGNTTETSLATVVMPSINLWAWPKLNVVPLPCLIEGTYYNASAFSPHSNGSHHIGVTDLLPDNTTGFVPDECLFSYYDPTSITKYLKDLMQGWAWYSMETYNKSGPDWVIELYEGDDRGGHASFATLDARWASIAASMTAQIRRNGDAVNSRPAPGRTWRTETCVRVQWAFLAYPASLLVLSMVFLGAAIWKSARAVGSVGRLAWKGSPLAVLFHGMDDRLREECRSADRLDEMGRVAKKVKVKIEEEPGGTRLVKA